MNNQVGENYLLNNPSIRNMEPSLHEKEQTLHIFQSSESGNYEMKKLVLKIRKQIYENEEVFPTCIQKSEKARKKIHSSFSS